jgi:HSP20 family protein
MANLIRRENRDVSRGRPQEFAWDPFRMMDALLRWDPFRSSEGWGSRMTEFVPTLDVKETKDAYRIKADLPGINERDVDISLTGNVLTISGRREEEHREEGDQFFAMERSYGTFARSLSLPDGADGEHVNAELKDGVLTVNIPKKPEVQPRRISIAGKSEGTAKARS